MAAMENRMNTQHVIVVITQTVLQAFFLKKDSPSPISIEGNTSIKYQSDDDFKMLVDSIKDTFNIDEFSDIPLSVIVINANADSVNADKLFKNFEKAEQHSLIRAENIIPYILACKGKLNKDESFNISLFDASYSIKSNDEKIECLPEKIDSQKNIEITAADFLTLFKVNPSAIGVDEGEISDLKDKIETLQQSVASKEKEIQEITEEKNKLQLTSDNLEKELENVRKQNELDSLHPACLSGLFTEDDQDNYVSFTYEPLCKSGSLVEEGQEIATIKAFTFVSHYKGIIQVHSYNVASILKGYIYFKKDNDDLSVTKLDDSPIKDAQYQRHAFGQIFCAISNEKITDELSICWEKLAEKKIFIEKIFRTPLVKEKLYRTNKDLVKILGIDPIVNPSTNVDSFLISRILDSQEATLGSSLTIESKKKQKKRECEFFDKYPILRKIITANKELSSYKEYLPDTTD